MITLREYLVHKRVAWQALKQRARAPDYTPLALKATVTVEGRSGIRRIRARDFQVITDSPPSYVGYDLGPSSPELVLGALGSCLAHSWLIQAAAHQLPLESVEVEVSARIDQRAGEPGHKDILPEPSGIRFTVRVASDAPTEAIEAVRQAVDRLCPILNLLRRPQAIEGTLAVAKPQRNGRKRSEAAPRRAKRDAETAKRSWAGARGAVAVPPRRLVRAGNGTASGKPR